MKSLSGNQRGVSFLILLLVLVALGAATLIGFRVIGQPKSELSGKDVTSQVKSPAKLQSKSDVRKAGEDLDSTPVDQGVNPDDLNSDLPSLL